MESDLEKAISEINFQLYQFAAVQQETSELEGLAERNIMILEILNQQGQMTVTQIAEAFPYAGESTISTAITRLWRDRELVSKKRDDQNQRTRIIELTDKGKKVIEELYSAAKKRENRGYADNGVQDFKTAAVDYLVDVFKVEGLNKDSEIVHAIGSKPALALMPHAFINPGDIIIADDDGVCVVRFAEAEEVLKKSKLRIQNENEKKERFKKGELGLDIYEMRERLKNKGLKYE